MEYSVSSSLMIVLIAQLVGIADVAELLALFGVNASMILFGWLQERYEAPGAGGWLPFFLGCLAGVVPWLAIGVYLLSLGSTSSVAPPSFVYGIFVPLFVLFNVFALNQGLKYRAHGRWSDHLFGERLYIPAQPHREVRPGLADLCRDLGIVTGAPFPQKRCRLDQRPGAALVVPEPGITEGGPCLFFRGSSRHLRRAEGGVREHELLDGTPGNQDLPIDSCRGQIAATPQASDDDPRAPH